MIVQSAVAFAELLARMVIVPLPVAVGVPLITRVAVSKATPAGKTRYDGVGERWVADGFWHSDSGDGRPRFPRLGIAGIVGEGWCNQCCGGRIINRPIIHPFGVGGADGDCARTNRRWSAGNNAGRGVECYPSGKAAHGGISRSSDCPQPG